MSHPAIDERHHQVGRDADGIPVWESEPYECGEWIPGSGTALCATHLAEAQLRHPQGWSYYPGDICPHGTYTGGSGIDWMCQPCEDGEFDIIEVTVEQVAELATRIRAGEGS